ncbi:hypothetical protein QE430_002271 [Microbacterium testaceum]|uniref:hypothetical protein n=1 Tax=Microbacterium TaxID=33882 RepID=UPI00277F689E|nr:hypothetical protein [Microbacterium testaceum]MDQ1173964.1 hypothetical protein [Microbacterium testaceum]
MTAVTRTIVLPVRPTPVEAALLALSRAMARVAEERMRRRAWAVEAEPARRAGRAASQAMSADAARYVLPR